MPFFRREKEEDEEYEEESLPRTPRAREFKDLISQHKRARKEPAKPWGRRERILVLAALFLTVAASIILAVSSRGWKLPGLPRLKLPSLSFFKEETIIIEKDKERAKNKEKSEKIIKEFEEETRKAAGVYGLYVVNLESGFSFGVYEDEEFTPASLNKLPVMLAMYMEAEKGNLNLETKYSLKATDKRGGSGSLYQKPQGFVLTYRDMVRYMGKESDNTAFNIASGILGREKIEGVIKEIGMTDTRVSGEDQKTTPYDVGLLFKKLWEGSLVSKKSADEILEYLTGTIYENWLVAGIPKEVKVAHKYGRELHVVNDAGIVFGERPYIVVILSKKVVEREADDTFPILSKIVYQGETL